MQNRVSVYSLNGDFKYYIGEDILRNSFQEFYRSYRLKTTSSDAFRKIIQQKTTKDLNWFFGDYIKTAKKIDYKIKKVALSKNKDSLEVTIKNKRNVDTCSKIRKNV